METCQIEPSKVTTLIRRHQTAYCLICFTFCQGCRFSEGDSIRTSITAAEREDLSCQCNNHLTKQALFDKVKKFINNIQQRPTDKASQLQYIRDSALLEEIYKINLAETLLSNADDLISQDKKRFSSLKGSEFNWQSMKQEDIDTRAELINFLLLSSNPLVKLKHPYSLYAKNILDKSFSDVESKNYNAVAAYHTSCMKLLAHTTFLNEIKYGLEKLDYQTLGSVNMIARVRIRERNVIRLARSEGANSRREWLQLIIKWADSYILDENKVWIRHYKGEVHQAHMYPIRFLRDMVVYGLISTEQQLADVMTALYNKVSKLKGIETTFLNSLKEPTKQDSNYISSNPKYVETVLADLRDIRGYYIEIVYHLFFLQIDFQMLERIRSGKVHVDGLRVFDQDFSRKTLEIYMGYVLRPLKSDNYHLIYGKGDGELCKIAYLVRKFIQIINNTDDEYIQSLWLTKPKDLQHYLEVSSENYERTDQMPLLKECSRRMQSVIEDYFVANKGLFEQEKVVDQLSKIVDEIVRTFRIDDRLLDMKTERLAGRNLTSPAARMQIYRDQLKLLESNMLFYLQTILVLFLKAGVKSETLKLKDRIFDIFKFGYFRNSMCISSFVQKSSLNKLEDVFPEDLFVLLDFSFYNNWIAFTSKGLLTFTKNIWNSTIKKLVKSIDLPAKKDQSSTYELLNGILRFVQKWNLSDEESVLKYLSSSSLQIVDELLFAEDEKGRIDILDALERHKLFQDLLRGSVRIEELLSPQEEFKVLYLETILSFVEKRYEYEVFQRLRRFFPLKLIESSLATTTGRARAILLSALEFLHIDVKNNLLEGREKLPPKVIPLKPTLYAQPYLMDEDYNRIIDILCGQLDKLLESLREGRLDKEYVINGILSPVLRLTAYFSMVPEDEALQLKEFKFSLDRLRQKLVKVSELEKRMIQQYGIGNTAADPIDITSPPIGSEQNIRSQVSDGRSPSRKGDQNSNHKLMHEEIEMAEVSPFPASSSVHPQIQLTNNWLKNRLNAIAIKLKAQDELDREKVELSSVCFVLWEYITRLIGSEKNSGKYNCFLENEDDPKRLLLQSKAKRQYLYSNKMDIRRREKDSSLMKYKQAVDLTRHQEGDFLTSLQTSYLEYKTTLTSTEAIDNYYLKKMVSTKEQDQDLIFNLCSYMVIELSKPISYKDRNPFYNIMQCLCNMLFVATTNTQNVLYAISKGRSREQLGDEEDEEDASTPIRWVQNLWAYMLQSNLFIRYKIHEDSVWMDEYMRMWLIVKLFHFLVEVNNQKWKNHFVVVPFELASAASVFGRKESYMSAFASVNSNEGQASKGMMMGLISLLEKMCKEQNWHTRTSQEGELQVFGYNIRQQLFDPAVLVIDLLNEIYSGPCVKAQRCGYTYLVDQINGILNRYIKDFNSPFYTLKNKCIEMLKCITEGGDGIVRRFILDNYPISMLNSVLVNSMKQLHCQFTAKKQGKPHPAQAIRHYTFEKGDHEALFVNYVTEPQSFGDSSLLNISYELFNYFSNMSKQSVKYKNFFKDKVRRAAQDESSVDKEIVSYQFLGRIAMKIQVRTDEADEELCFKAPGKFVFLSTETRNEFESEVDRSSGTAKINSLISQYKYFKMEMDHYEKHFRQRYWFFKYIVENLYVAEVIVYLLCLALNITLIYDLGIENNSQAANLSLFGAYQGIGWSIVVLCLLTWLTWVISRLGFSFAMAVDQLDDTLPEDEEVTNLQKALILIKILFGDPESLVFLYHIIMCLLGMYVNVCFFALELLIIVNRVSTLNYIVKSVYLHWDQLLLTFLLECLIIYVYGFICYISYQGRFLLTGSLETDKTSTNQPYCQNIVHCWMNFMNQGITSGNGIGILMGTESYSDGNQGFFYSRFFVDVTFYLIVNVVMINIIQGIIVDTFSQLRQNSEAYEKDKYWVCFICNQKYENFVSRGQSFYKHVENEHNMWKYVYFLVYLDEKNEKDCDGLQSKLKTMVRNQDSSWIPIVKEEDAVAEAIQKQRQQQKKLVGTKLKHILQDFRLNLHDRLAEQKSK